MQQVSCQFAIYPLGPGPLGPAIDAAIEAVRAHGLQVEPGAMSTIIAGPSDVVFAALADGFEAAAHRGCVLVATVSNTCPT
ncbi:MAG: MTH1187 family thiamine-binding protein [Nitriliruptoraceae bacterium]